MAILRKTHKKSCDEKLNILWKSIGFRIKVIWILHFGLFRISSFHIKSIILVIFLVIQKIQEVHMVLYLKLFDKITKIKVLVIIFTTKTVQKENLKLKKTHIKHN